MKSSLLSAVVSLWLLSNISSCKSTAGNQADLDAAAAGSKYPNSAALFKFLKNAGVAQNEDDRLVVTIDCLSGFAGVTCNIGDDAATKPYDDEKLWSLLRPFKILLRTGPNSLSVDCPASAGRSACLVNGKKEIAAGEQESNDADSDQDEAGDAEEGSSAEKLWSMIKKYDGDVDKKSAKISGTCTSGITVNCRIGSMASGKEIPELTRIITSTVRLKMGQNPVAIVCNKSGAGRSLKVSCKINGLPVRD
ncbi:MAG: hypothetical protein RIQ81_1630 [Pseudomonadota bacterium]|jgi:hypothetical protein